MSLASVRLLTLPTSSLIRMDVERLKKNMSELFSIYIIPVSGAYERGVLAGFSG